LLAGAKPIGKLNGVAASSASIYAFQALPDGKSSDVLIAWDNEGPSNLWLPIAPIAAYDNIGRTLAPTKLFPSISLTVAPVFIVLPPGSVSRWTAGQRPSFPQPDMLPSPTPPHALKVAPPSPVVLQAIFSPQQLILGSTRVGGSPISNSTERFGNDHHVEIFAYNFSNSPLTIKVTVTVPEGWNFNLRNSSIMLPPTGRTSLSIELSPPPGWDGAPAAIRLMASNPNAGDSVLEFHLSQ
jgi:hypothetical protein